MQKPTSKKKVFGTLQIILGCAGMVVLGVLYLIVWIVSIFAHVNGNISIFFLVGLFFCTFFTVLGIRKVRLSDRTEPERIIKPKPASTGNTEHDNMINSANAYLTELSALDAKITNIKIKEHLKEIIKTYLDITNLISQTPEKIRYIRELLNYYLPTTVKLLNEYHQMSSQQVRGKNIENSIESIESFMVNIVETFHKSLDNLYQDKAIDIETDIEVMKRMTEQDHFN